MTTTEAISRTGSEDDDTLEGGAGNDTLAGGKGNDTLYGSDGNDSLSGGEGRDTLFGGRGDDILTGGKGYDTLFGGLGADTFVFAMGDGPDAIAGFEPGVDTIKISGVSGGFASLVIEQAGTNTTVRYGDGDTINLQNVSADSLSADDFSLPAVVPAEDVPQGGSGDETTSKDPLAGDPPDNDAGEDGTSEETKDDPTDDGSGGGEALQQQVLAGDPPDGNGGDDTATEDTRGETTPGRGGKGSDTLDGGAGDDVLRGRRGDDTLNGHGGADTLQGGRGDDTLDGGAGDDKLRGGRGDDILTGGEGDDSLYGGPGTDTFVFKAADGSDTITDFEEGDRIRLNGVSVAFEALDIRQDGTDTVVRYGEGDTITLSDVSADYLTKKDFDLPASPPPETDDNSDTVVSGAGTVDSTKNTPLPGTPDQNNPSDASQKSNKQLSASPRVTTPHDDDWDGKGAGIDYIQKGTDGDDTLAGGGVLLGGAGDDTLEDGGNGDDILHGGSGDDTLNDSSGDDTLYGGSGDDTLNDSWGNDTFVGGRGTDTLNGSQGDNTFVFRVGDGNDTITGFSLDKIHLYGVSDDFGWRNVRQEGDDVVISYGTDGDTITLTDTKAGMLYLNSRDFVGSGGAKPAILASHGIWGKAENLLFVFEAGQKKTTPHDDDWDGAGSGSKRIQKGTAGDDTIATWLGSAFPGVLLGGGGDDVLNDKSRSNDILHGGSGDDTLNGGVGDDTLYGGSGDDVLRGGRGNDTFVFQPGSGIDTITDFGLSGTFGFGGDKVEINGVSGGFGSLAIRHHANMTFVFYGTNDVIRLQRVSEMSADSLGADDFVFPDANKDVPGTHQRERLTAPTDDGWDGTGAILPGVIQQGTGGNDTLTGTDSTDIQLGGPGNDSLKAGRGDDILHGGAGDDTLEGGKGNDILYGGSGDDTFVMRKGGYEFPVVGQPGVRQVADGRDTVADFGEGDTIRIEGPKGIAFRHLDIRRDGADTVIYVSSSSWSIRLWNVSTVSLDRNDAGISVTAGNGEILNGGADNDILRGSEGGDILYSGGGNDTLDGGDGNDFLYDSGRDDGSTLYGGNGDDTLIDSWGDDTLDGGAGDDTLDASWGRNTLEGGLGNDTLISGHDEDTFVFQPGDGDDIIDGFGRGIDKIRINGISGGFGTLDIRQGGADVIISYGERGDTITLQDVSGSSLEADDFVLPDSPPPDERSGRVRAGSPGDDVLTGGKGDDTLSGDEGNDTLDGSAGNDTLQGGKGDDTLRGGTGNDILEGGPGADTFVFTLGDGNDLIEDFGAGDKIHFDKFPGRFDTLGIDEQENDDGSLDTVISYGNTGDTIRLARVSADSLDKDDFQFSGVTLRGSDGDDVLKGSDGDDNLFGFVGQGSGFAGNDKLYGYAGNDSLWGSAGDDKLYGGAGDDTLGAGDGDDRLEGGTGHDTLFGGAGDDTLYGGAGNDTLWSSTGDDDLYGGTGDDTLGGNDGDDTLYGEAGDDTLFGGDGVDEIKAGAGKDKVFGGRGSDTLWGGKGNDTLTGGLGADTFVFEVGDGNDSIVYFNRIEGDKIHINGVSGGFGALDIGQDGVGNAVISYGNAGDTVTLQGVSTSSLTSADFVISA